MHGEGSSPERKGMSPFKGQDGFSKKGKWTHVSLWLLGVVEKRLGLGKVSDSDREIYFP